MTKFGFLKSENLRFQSWSTSNVTDTVHSYDNSEYHRFTKWILDSGHVALVIEDTNFACQLCYLGRIKSNADDVGRLL